MVHKAIVKVKQLKQACHPDIKNKETFSKKTIGCKNLFLHRFS
jgi:hypothetical protein